MLGSQLGIFFILILFKQLLSDKIFLGQGKKLRSILNWICSDSVVFVCFTFYYYY